MREKYKNQTEAKPGPHQVVLILDNLKGNFNVGKIFRSAEVFGVQEIHLIDIPYFDPVPAKGTIRKVPATWNDTFEVSYALLKAQGYQFYAFDAGASTYMHKTSFPKKSAFIMGHEGFGLSFQLEDFPDIQKIKIQQFGKTESLNVSVAASLSVYEYVRQNYQSDIIN